MFKDEEDIEKVRKANEISKWLIDREVLKSHSRRLLRNELESKGLKISRLEDDPELERLVLSVFQTLQHTFEKTVAVKIVENHKFQAHITLNKMPAKEEEKNLKATQPNNQQNSRRNNRSKKRRR